TLPGSRSVESAQEVLRVAGLERSVVGALIHASVCRDFLEPATACRVHHELGLPQDCLVYDVSNACLGILNGIVQVANMIELGQIRAGIVVGTESSRQLVETTIAALNANTSLTRNAIKSAIASLTIGSGSAAVLLVHRSLSRSGNRLLAAGARAFTAGHALCHSDGDQAAAGDMHPLMETDSEQLMQQGIAAGVATFGSFLEAADWSHDQIDKTFCHQVGSAHRKLMLASLAIDPSIDFATYETLGNTGSVALPVTLALGAEQGHLKSGDRVALLGIGSGINSLMLALEWRRTLVAGRDESSLAPGQQLPLADVLLSPA
ncbi:MAG TPA: 3-oxoacyl-ACP synthase III, partial [Pirellulales bacterium]|nr:3-oxoacyl-ACP synthase III [Pirellulales bacterium]